MRLTLGNLLSLVLSLTISLISPSALTQTTDPMLNGIAIHSEFGKPQFIGALYSSSLSDRVDDLNNALIMRMEMKILAAEGLTLRRFSRMWIEAMSVNNDAALLTAQADNMVLFDSLFKDRLQQNDTILFSYRQTKGVSISLNKVLLGSIDDDQFFAMLLRSWVGKVPLSTDYKNGLLQAGKVTSELQSRFANIQPSSKRSREIEKWLNSKSPGAPAAGIPTPSILAASAPAASKKSSDIHTRATPASSKQSPAVEPEAAAKPLGHSEAATSALQQMPSSEEKTADAGEKSSLTAHSLLARQFYISQLLKKIRGNTRYPKRANELGQSDSVRVALVIDRQGKVVSTSFVQGSQYSLLNEAALDAIKKSSPLPPMPDTLTDATFEFTVPINFVAAGKK